MTTAQFFEKFDLFANSPEAVAKMRELIVRFALNGEFSVGGRSSWQKVELGELLEVQNGFAFKSQLFNQAGKGLPLIRIRDIAKSSTEVHYSGDYREEFLVSRGDLLIGMDGNFNIHRWKGPAALLNQRVCRLQNISSRLDQQFLFYFVQEHLDEIHRNTTYTTVKHISSKQIKAIQLALPPIAEQKRIVAKVDELMALCDQLEAQQQERETKNTALAQATLARFAEAPTPANFNLLFHSSFSIQPSDLRKTILKLAMRGQLGAHKQIKTVRLDSLGSWAQGCGFPVAEQGHKDRPILFSKVSDMNLPGNEREIKTTNNTIDDKTAKRLRIKVHPKGAVIFPKIGGAIATNKRRILTRPTAIDNNCSGIIPNETCSTEWLYLVLSGIDFAQYQTGTSVPAVNQGALGEIPVALPPLAEQKRIVAKVEELMALVDALEAQQASADQAATHLLDAVVSELAAAA